MNFILTRIEDPHKVARLQGTEKLFEAVLISSLEFWERMHNMSADTGDPEISVGGAK